MREHLTEHSSIEQEKDLIEEIQTGYFDIDIDGINSLDMADSDFDECERLRDDYGF